MTTDSDYTCAGCGRALRLEDIWAEVSWSCAAGELDGYVCRACLNHPVVRDDFQSACRGLDKKPIATQISTLAETHPESSVGQIAEAIHVAVRVAHARLHQCGGAGSWRPDLPQAVVRRAFGAYFANETDGWTPGHRQFVFVRRASAEDWFERAWVDANDHPCPYFQIDNGVRVGPLTLSTLETLFEQCCKQATPHHEPDFDKLRAVVDGDPKVSGTLVSFVRDDIGWLHWYLLAVPGRDGQPLWFEIDLLPGQMAPADDEIDRILRQPGWLVPATQTRDPPDPARTTYSGLTAAYDYFNTQLFGGRLPHCLVTLQCEGSSYGYFSEQRFGTRDRSEITDEIALNPRHFRYRTPRDTLSTLVHEMCHLERFHFGTPSRTSHNKEWGILMDRIGLVPTATGDPGGQRTGAKMDHYVLEGGPFARACDEFEARGVDLPYLDLANDPIVRYTCPGCELSAWGKPELNLICGKCLRRLV